MSPKMWITKERNGKKGVPCVMTVVVSTVLLACVFPSYAQALTADFRHSETCYGTGNCSLHDLRCDAGSRLAVLQANYGFKPKQIADSCVSEITGDVCPQHCCRYNASSDCTQKLTANNMQLLQSECSHSASCQIRAQRGDNTHCNIDERGITSTVSVLRTVCVPDATTVNPCSNATIHGHSVSLFLSPPAPSSPCQCTIHKTDTNTTNNNNGNVDFYAYEVESSTAGWEMRLEDGVGSALKTLKGVVKVFPAVSVSSTESSLPLTLTVSFSNLSDTPTRLWLGFRGTESSVTLRCGQDAIDHTMSLTTTTPIPTTTTAPATTTSLETTTAAATTTASSNTTSIATTTMMVPTTTSKEPTRTTAGASGAASMPLTSEDPNKATKGTLTGDQDDIASTDVIVYVAVGVSALILCAFIYVCIRRLRKKQLLSLSDTVRDQYSPSSFTINTTPTPSPTEAALTGAPRLVSTWSVLKEDPPKGDDPDPSPEVPPEKADAEDPKIADSQPTEEEAPCPMEGLEMVTCRS